MSADVKIRRLFFKKRIICRIIYDRLINLTVNCNRKV